MLIPSDPIDMTAVLPSLSRRVNANSQRIGENKLRRFKLIKKGEC